MDSVKNNPIYKIAGIISNSSKGVIDELEDLLTDISDYYESHVTQYDERGMDFEEEEEENLKWIGMVDILIKHQYVCECDWKAGLTDEFLYNMEKIKGIKENNLKLEESWFDEEDDIVTWCEILDEKWKPQNMCVAAIDIDSDSYVMFPCGRDILDTLNAYAGELDFQIILACEL